MSTQVGPKLGGAAASGTTPGTVDWSSLSNALTQNGQYALAAVDATPTTSHPLQVTGFDFSEIPDDKEIVGIAVQARTAAVPANGILTSARLMVGGAIVGNDLAANNALGSTGTPSELALGGDGELWGLLPTVAEIKASNFGVALQVSSVSGGVNAGVDVVRILVWYDDPPPEPEPEPEEPEPAMRTSVSHRRARARRLP